MSNFLDVFARKEVKYLLSDKQYTALLTRLQGLAEVDAYGKTTICNIYYDTPDFALIRRSLAKPSYKEKLRLRSYGIAKDDSTAFVEIKKKYRGIVYKRRIALPYKEAVAYLAGESSIEKPSQISREIDYMLGCYSPIVPAMEICYERIAMAGIHDPALRITFDTDIRWSTNKERGVGSVLPEGEDKDGSFFFDLRHPFPGIPILDRGEHLMELKIQNAMNLQLSYILDELDIRPVSFSKYGRGFMQYEALKAKEGISPAKLLSDAMGSASDTAKSSAIPTPPGQCHGSVSSGHGQEVRYA